MPENEYKEILDREKHVKDVTEHFTPQIDLLQDLTNYGSNLIPRLFVSSDKQLVDIIVIGVLLKQVVSMIDGAELLVAKAAIHAAQLEVRAAYEASVYIEWILKSDSEKKAKCYYVSNLRNERLWALRSMEGTEEKEKFTAITEEINFDIHKERPEITDEAQQHLEQVNKILAQDTFKDVDAEFEAIKQKDRLKREPLWYRPMKIYSIRQIAREVSRIAEYDLFYSIGSQVTHSSSYKDHITLKEGKVYFKPIRYLEKLGTLLNFLVSTTIRTYMKTLEQYRPGELPAFRDKYANDWRNAFRGIKNVNYNITNEETII